MSGSGPGASPNGHNRGLVHRGPVTRHSASQAAIRRRSSTQWASTPAPSNAIANAVGVATAARITRFAASSAAAHLLPSRSRCSLSSHYAASQTPGQTVSPTVPRKPGSRHRSARSARVESDHREPANRARTATRRALCTVFTVPSAGGQPPRERAIPRANVDRFRRHRATPGDCQAWSSASEPHRTTSGDAREVTGGSRDRRFKSGRPDW